MVVPSATTVVGLATTVDVVAETPPMTNVTAAVCVTTMASVVSVAVSVLVPAVVDRTVPVVCPLALVTAAGCTIVSVAPRDDAKVTVLPLTGLLLVSRKVIVSVDVPVGVTGTLPLVVMFSVVLPEPLIVDDPACEFVAKHLLGPGHFHQPNPSMPDHTGQRFAIGREPEGIHPQMLGVDAAKALARVGVPALELAPIHLTQGVNRTIRRHRAGGEVRRAGNFEEGHLRRLIWRGEIKAREGEVYSMGTRGRA